MLTTSKTIWLSPRPTRNRCYTANQPGKGVCRLESCLNLLWLTIVLIATLWWRIHYSRQGVTQGPSKRRYISLGCSYLLLFFAVSMTDDLHAEALVTLSTDHRHMIASTCQDHHFSSQSGTSAPTTPLAVLPNRATVDRPRFFDKVSIAEEVSHSGPANRHLSARSPPDHC